MAARGPSRRDAIRWGRRSIAAGFPSEHSNGWLGTGPFSCDVKLDLSFFGAFLGAISVALGLTCPLDRRDLEHALIEQFATEPHQARRIHVEQARRGASGWREPDNHPLLNRDMVFPVVESRVEQLCLRLGL